MKVYAVVMSEIGKSDSDINILGIYTTKKEAMERFAEVKEDDEKLYKRDIEYFKVEVDFETMYHFVGDGFECICKVQEIDLPLDAKGTKATFDDWADMCGIDKDTQEARLAAGLVYSVLKPYQYNLFQFVDWLLGREGGTLNEE